MRRFLVLLVFFWVCTITVLGIPITAHSCGPICYGPPIYSAPPLYVAPLFIPPVVPVFTPPQVCYPGCPVWTGLGIRIDLPLLGRWNLGWVPGGWYGCF